MMDTLTVLRVASQCLVTLVIVYVCFVALLATPFCQRQVVYLHRIKLTWFQDVNYPERWGFLHNQVTPFFLRTSDGEKLHLWHVLPLEIYRRNERALLSEPSGFASDVTDRLSFRLLREDPDALLVLYLHGAAGTLGSGWRPQSYRALYSGASDRIHVCAIDYRGFGQSSGTPSEEGLLIDALTLADWAIDVAKIPPSRIVLFGQSIGTAVSISLAHHLAIARPTPTLFAGMVLVAPFVNVRALTATYRVAGIIPLLSPVAYFPKLLDFLNGFATSKWASNDRLADLVKFHGTLRDDKRHHHSISTYHINIIHAIDDYDIPWSHSERLFWYAVNASLPTGISFEDLEVKKGKTKTNLGAGGWSVEHQTENGVIREDILHHGLHDVCMSYPTVALAVLRAFKRMG